MSLFLRCWQTTAKWFALFFAIRLITKVLFKFDSLKALFNEPTDKPLPTWLILTFVLLALYVIFTFVTALILWIVRRFNQKGARQV